MKDLPGGTASSVRKNRLFSLKLLSAISILICCSSQSQMKPLNLCGCSRRTCSPPELTDTRSSLVRGQEEIMCHPRSNHSGSVYVYMQKECGKDLNPPSHPTVGGMMSIHGFSLQRGLLICCQVAYAVPNYLTQFLPTWPHLPEVTAFPEEGRNDRRQPGGIV